MQKKKFLLLMSLVVLVVVAFGGQKAWLSWFSVGTDSNDKSSFDGVEQAKTANSAFKVQQKQSVATFSDDVRKVNDENTLGENFDRLVELNDDIDSNNQVLKNLVDKYDQNLDDSSSKDELSNALLTNKDYRSDMLEKFKIERDLAKLK